MYAVVGCSDCGALWIVEGRPESSQCPRCGTTRQYAKRKQFVTTEDADHAREVRASMLATDQGHGDAFAEMDSFAEMDDYVDEAGPSDDEYLAGSGLDPDAVEAAGERAGPGGGGRGGSQSREAVVREALRELEGPSEADVVGYASERDVPEAYVRRALEKLVRGGEVSESQGTYRLL
jgi:hypothetical protein